MVFLLLYLVEYPSGRPWAIIPGMAGGPSVFYRPRSFYILLDYHARGKRSTFLPPRPRSWCPPDGRKTLWN